MRVTGLAALATATALLLSVTATSASAAVAGRTFYVDTTGNDLSDGLSPATAWHSLDRVNRQVLVPGDTVLLKGGKTFDGSLLLGSAEAGSATSPVTIGSFGTGRAIVASAGNTGVSVYNTAGVVIRDLVVKGNPTTYHNKPGIGFYNDLAGNLKLSRVIVTRVDVSGFKNGVEIGGGLGTSGFRDVAVTSATLHDNMEAGLISYGPAVNPAAPAYAHQGLRVSGVAAYRNLGDPANAIRPTGSGIVLASVQGATVEWSRAYDNGSAAVAPRGPVGIWTYDSNRVVIQHNVSHHNRSGGPDGGGFDMDRNVSASTFQYNLSYANDGAGYLLFTGKSTSGNRDNVVRFNLSSKDSQKSISYGGITIWGPIKNAQIYNNTVIAQPNGTVRPAAVRLVGNPSGVAIRNNILLSNGAGPTVSAPALPTTAAVLQGNAYYSATTGANVRIVWGGASYPTLSSWRSATAQESVGSKLTGIAGDPQLVDYKTALAVTDPRNTAGARGLSLRSTSPLIGAGLDLKSLFGIAPGSRDYFGNAIASGAPSDVGAHHPTR